MDNHHKLVEAFVRALGVQKEQVVDSLRYQEIEKWDSISHMILIAELEDTFGIEIETHDVIEMSSVAKAKAIVAKHGIEF